MICGDLMFEFEFEFGFEIEITVIDRVVARVIIYSRVVEYESCRAV